MTEAILYVVSGFFALIFIVRSIIDATIKINIQMYEKNEQATKSNETHQILTDLQRVLNTTLQDFHSDVRQQLSLVQELSTLTKVNTGRLASVERHVIALHTMVVSDTPNQNTMPFPFPIPGMSGLPGSGMGPGGMWRPLGIKRDGDKYKTEDGEHEADSLEELLSKLANDPQYRIDPHFKQVNPGDIEDMKKMFEDQLEEEDEEDDREDWQKGEK